MFDNHHIELRPMETLNPNPKGRTKNEFDYEWSLFEKNILEEAPAIDSFEPGNP